MRTPRSFGFIETNPRTLEACLGDLRALIVALDLMAQKVAVLVAFNGLADLDELAGVIIDRTAQAMRRGIREAIAPGDYTYEMRTDGYQRETLLRVVVTVDQERVKIDFTGSAGQSPFGVNCCWNYVYGWATFGQSR